MASAAEKWRYSAARVPGSGAARPRRRASSSTARSSRCPGREPEAQPHRGEHLSIDQHAVATSGRVRRSQRHAGPSVSRRGLYTYPDVVAVCGEPRFEDDESTRLLNPTLVIEVLSPSTERYDRGKKFSNYQRGRFAPRIRARLPGRRSTSNIRPPGTRAGSCTIYRRRDDLMRLASIGCRGPAAGRLCQGRSPRGEVTSIGTTRKRHGNRPGLGRRPGIPADPLKSARFSLYFSLPCPSRTGPATI